MKKLFAMIGVTIGVFVGELVNALPAWAAGTTASASIVATAAAATASSKEQLAFWDPEVLIPLGLKALANIVFFYLIFIYVRYLHTATGPNPSRKPMSRPEEIICGAIILVIVAALAPFTVIGTVLGPMG